MAVTLSIALAAVGLLYPQPPRPATFPEKPGKRLHPPGPDVTKVPFYPPADGGRFSPSVIVVDFRSLIMESPLTGVGPVGAVSVRNTDFSPH